MEGILAQSKFVSAGTPARQIHYLELGVGNPVILVHGGGSHSTEWMSLLRPLSQHFHLFVVDRPGCGLTYEVEYATLSIRDNAVEFLGSCMDALSLEKASIVGNSMGGYFSLCFALQHSERVKKLLLIGAPAGLNLWVPVMLRVLGMPGVNKLLLHSIARPSVENLKKVYKELLVADIDKVPLMYLQHSFWGQLLPGAVRGFLSLLENALTLRGFRKDLYIGEKLGQLKIPVRFIWGDRDVYEKPKTGIQKAAAIPDSQFHVVENAGHCPWFDQPHQCAQLATAMLQD